MDFRYEEKTKYDYVDDPVDDHTHQPAMDSSY